MCLRVRWYETIQWKKTIQSCVIGYHWIMIKHIYKTGQDAMKACKTSNIACKTSKVACKTSKIACKRSKMACKTPRWLASLW